MRPMQPPPSPPSHAIAAAEEDAWTAAMSAGAVLRGHVELIETPDASLGAGALQGAGESINVQVHDPQSRAFAMAVPDSAHRRVWATDVGGYARATKSAMATWAALALRPGYRVQENPAFWCRVLESTTGRPCADVVLSKRFPQFRVTIHPKDCYDEDRDQPGDAIDWVRVFCSAFFCDGGLKIAKHHVDVGRDLQLPIQLIFRTPMLRTSGPLGASIQQHPQYLANVALLAGEIMNKNHLEPSSIGIFRVDEVVSELRGSLRVQELIQLVRTCSCPNLRLTEMCIDDLDGVDEALMKELALAFRHSTLMGLDELTLNVAKASKDASAGIATLLRMTSIRRLRLFNAFSGALEERLAKWELLGRALRRSMVNGLVLERTQLGLDEATALRAGYSCSARPHALQSLTIHPLPSSVICPEAFVSAVQTLSHDLHHLNVSALSLQASEVDHILSACPSVTSLHLGEVDELEHSALLGLIATAPSRLRTLTVRCSDGAVRALATALTTVARHLPLETPHLRELSLNVGALEGPTVEAILGMLEVNSSLDWVHFHSRDVNFREQTRAIQRQHLRRLDRKLPLRSKLAFLSVLGHPTLLECAPGRAESALHGMDAGIASEILGLAGHSVRRRIRVTV